MILNIYSDKNILLYDHKLVNETRIKLFVEQKNSLEKQMFSSYKSGYITSGALVHFLYTVYD